MGVDLYTTLPMNTAMIPQYHGGPRSYRGGAHRFVVYLYLYMGRGEG